MSELTVTIDGWDNGGAIPSKFAFGQIPDEGRFELGGNINPAISWAGAPDGTRSFALICHDPDVPSSGEDVNQEGRDVPADLPRVDFYHWVVANIPAATTAIAEGVASSGVTPKGKAPGARDYGVVGINDYTNWFAGDADMGGDYADYDGPCPPWNDTIMHHYHFTVYALDVDAIDVSGAFTGQDVLDKIAGHVLAEGSYMGTYTMRKD